MNVFFGPLLRVGGILVLFAAVGTVAASALAPRGKSWRSARIVWGCAAGLMLLALSVPIGFFCGVSVRVGALILAALALAVSYKFRVPGSELDGTPSELETRNSRLGTLIFVVLAALCGLGVAVHALQALAEPMWSNDFLAIWGLKGKLFFRLGAIPAGLFAQAGLAFSHPEYPLGLPFLYAGLAFLLGRWDDHAMALVFPFIQVATLGALFTWLRRRGAARNVAMGAAALLALYSPLYSAFHTGLAEVPLSFALLLLGTAVSDAIDETDPGAVRRLALASFLAVGLKNEGLFLVLASLGLVGAALRGERRGRVAAALLVPAAVVLGLHRYVAGGAPLKDFDLGLLLPARWAALLSRLGEALGVAAREIALPAWPVLAAAAVLFFAGRRTPFADRLLLLAACALAVYLFLPGLAVLPARPELGPAWLVRTSLARTCSALAPLVAAGIAGRLSSVDRAR